MPNPAHELAQLQRQVIACTRCANLITYCRKVAEEKRRMYRDCDYWGKPVPSFGDPRAELLILGLAPGAHGANRTGRMFTGDRSGDFSIVACMKPDSRASPPRATQATAWNFATVTSPRRFDARRPRTNRVRKNCETASRSWRRNWKS